ncbi:MAG: polyhydroxyalkanoate synthesis repressor PhaR [Gammaproteobacteria bacterium]|nr:polyhydroxyalkanoate synthesis repressor PhaR [Gammaproteobacteria bacterium]
MNRIIKKYPNRRLYDCEESRYITLADIKELVLRDVAFTVIDKKTGDDISRVILLAVISEQEQHGEAILSASFLAQLIRACDTASAAHHRQPAESGPRSGSTQENQLLGQIKQAVGSD